MVLTEDTARSALSQALDSVDLATTGPVELVRIGTNAVFRVGRDVVARLAVSSEDGIANATKQIEVSRWLRSENYPAVSALQIAQPVEACQCVATFWTSVSPREEFASVREVGSLIRRLHILPEPNLALPAVDPFHGPPPAEFPGLAHDDSTFLVRRIRESSETFRELPFVLPGGHIHGDANVGNVILSSNGEAIVIDLDNFSIGPREWDLIQTALFYDRLGWHTETEYAAFVEAYGFDLMKWTGYEDLADIREVAMTAWLSRKAEHSSASAREAAKRINAIRTGGSRRDWGAY